MTFIVATNVIASRPPERQPTRTPHARAKMHPRDVGVELSRDRTFNMHIEKKISAANQLVGWALRSYRRGIKLVLHIVL